MLVLECMLYNDYKMCIHSPLNKGFLRERFVILALFPDSLQLIITFLISKILIKDFRNSLKTTLDDSIRILILFNVINQK